MINRSYNLSPEARRQSNQPFWQRFLMSQRFLALVFLVLLIAIAFPLVRSISQRKMIEQEITDMKNDNEAYRNKSQDLKNMIDYLQSDVSLEEQARLNLGLKKPNEVVVVVSQSKSVSTTATSVEEESRITNWRRWLHYFFK